jgi:hypothetical protein
MDSKKNLSSIYIRVVRSANPQADKLIKEQLNSTFTHNPRIFRKELIKKIKKSRGVDSSYYLG